MAGTISTGKGVSSAKAKKAWKGFKDFAFGSDSFHSAQLNSAMSTMFAGSKALGKATDSMLGMGLQKQMIGAKSAMVGVSASYAQLGIAQQRADLARQTASMNADVYAQAASSGLSVESGAVMNQIQMNYQQADIQDSRLQYQSDTIGEVAQTATDFFNTQQKIITGGQIRAGVEGGIKAVAKIAMPGGLAASAGGKMLGSMFNLFPKMKF